MTVPTFLRRMASNYVALTTNDYKDHSLPREYAKDLDCPAIWASEMRSLLPNKFHYMGSNDLMSTLPEGKRPENLMVYIGGEGTYTPIHTDMCATIGHNLMVDAYEGSSALWFFVPESERKMFDRYMATLGVNLHMEKYFMSLRDWENYPGTAIVVEQRVGDFIIVPSLCPHQVWNRGLGNLKIAWNRTTATTLQKALAVHLPEYRSVCRDEQYMVKQNIYDACSKYAMKIYNSQRLDEWDGHVFTRLVRLLREIVADEQFSSSLTTPSTITLIPDGKYSVACSFCRCDIFNHFLSCPSCVASDDPEDTFDLCLECFIGGRACAHPTGLQWNAQYEPKALLDQYWSYVSVGIEKLGWQRSAYEFEHDRRSLVDIAVEVMRRRPDAGRIAEIERAIFGDDVAEGFDPEVSLCHMCSVYHPRYRCAECRCGREFCYQVLHLAYGQEPLDIQRKGREAWLCPACQESCLCVICNDEGSGKAHSDEVVLPVDTSAVAHLSGKNWLINENVGNEDWRRGGNKTYSVSTSR